ncbi:DUF3800 domain-containing protein [Schaalia sp. ZJ405]|uniref:DUF3800 domain-containing protein n=1 Tax=Schaalia sp. ZJ405 TaxID=2709403 RepID=UPI0013EC8182|nr:DUF3800 domain-containing protein [Schaalia sp. ZJ405]QPK81229.1 DUF3800 domain-containing protein [Schaalia sp. ZJ405]
MLVFIDDSGDAGVKFNRGSSEYLVLASCIFPTEADYLALKGVLENAPDYLKRKNGEFKHSKMKEAHREEFFRLVSENKFSVRVIIVDKRILTSDFLKSNGSTMKAYFIKQLLTHTWGTIKDATIVIDGADLRAFHGIRTTKYLMERVNRNGENVAKEIVCRDSKVDIGLQLADMVAGTVMSCFQGKISIHSSNRAAQVRNRARRPTGTWWKFDNRR